MKKLEPSTVRACYQCPYATEAILITPLLSIVFYCKNKSGLTTARNAHEHMHRVRISMLEDMDTIPDFCPLPDYTQENSNEPV